MRHSVWAMLLLMVVGAFMVYSARRTASFEPDDFVNEIRVDGPRVTVVAAPRGDRRATTRSRTVKVANLPAAPRVIRIETQSLPTAAARTEAIDQARAQLTRDLNLAHAPQRSFFERPDVANIVEVKGDTIEGIDTSRILLTATLTREVERELLDADRQVVASERVESAGRGVAMLTVLFGAIAGFVRIDEWTKGYYTKRLGALLGGLVLAATALIVSA